MEPRSAGLGGCVPGGIAAGASHVVPRFRGVLHMAGFFLTLPLAPLLVLRAPTGAARVGAIAFAASVTAMFGVSALFHRIRWAPVWTGRIAILDHAMIYTLIAGTYTPFALLVLHPDWRVPILATTWGAALLATILKFRFRHAPAWVAAASCVLLGWIAVLVLPQIVARVGIAGSALLLAGGAAYTVGAVVYARRRPDPVPAVFGYHEVFHSLVVAGVACQYATVAFFVLPRA